ncbi:MAG: hypothetical protein QM645_06450 [Asticcacaulis sp.]
MRTLNTCMQCLVENGLPDFSSLRFERIPDDGVIEFICDRGHHTFTIIQEAKFEILSELAVTALCDGYYREAVASFASALERLYEFYIDVVRRARGIEQDVFDKAWKPLRKSSERQLGAFMALYLMENNEAFLLLDDKHVGFRNEVIHQGKIPDRAEAIAYGQAVANCASPLITLINSARYEKVLRELIFDSIWERSQRARAIGARHSTQSMVTPFRHNPDSLEINLEAILDERAKRPDMDQAVKESHALGKLIDTLKSQVSPGQG